MAYEPVVTDASSRNGAVKSVTWSNLPQASAGDWLEWPDFSLRSFHVYGTFGGASVSIYGSNDWPTPPANSAIIQTWQGTACTLTTAGFLTPRDAPLWVQPVVAGGNGTTSITVTAAIHRQDMGATG